MHPVSEALQSGILSRQAVGIALILTVAAMAVVNRSLLQEFGSDPARGWRVVARSAGIAGALTLAWVTMFDDWLQLVVEPYRHSMRWEYQRIQFDPVNPDYRAASVVLITGMVILLAMLVARHVSGYVFQIGALLVSVLAWIPMFILNQRLNALIIQGAADDTSPVEVAGLTVFWLVRLAMGVAMVVVSLAAATMVVSLVVSAVLDVLRAREPRTSQEADAFFASLHQRAEDTPDRSIRSFWRPIERPM